MKHTRILSIALVVSFMMAGCSSDDSDTPPSTNEGSTLNGDNKEQVAFVPELNVSFGRDEEPFTMFLYDNQTARAISSYVGSSVWNLPIYNFDDYENYEVMQFYDIPDRYEIPENPEIVTSEKAGEVYYSQPNRIVLFYKDANITGEYTKLGYFDATGSFVSAVENNPVVQGYSNKIVSIKPAD